VTHTINETCGHSALNLVPASSTQWDSKQTLTFFISEVLCQ
jgi:hypothetical protein